MLQFLFQYVFQLQGDIGVLARVPIYINGVEVAHVLLVLSFRTDKLFYLDGFVVQVDFSKIIHSVMQFGLEHIVGYHCVKHLALYFDSVVRQDQHIVFDVLPDFQGFLIFEDRLEFIHDALRFDAVGRDGDIESLVFGIREAHSYQFGTYRVCSGGLCI